MTYIPIKTGSEDAPDGYIPISFSPDTQPEQTPIESTQPIQEPGVFDKVKGAVSDSFNQFLDTSKKIATGVFDLSEVDFFKQAGAGIEADITERRQKEQGLKDEMAKAYVAKDEPALKKAVKEFDAIRGQRSAAEVISDLPTDVKDTITTATEAAKLVPENIKSAFFQATGGGFSQASVVDKSKEQEYIKSVDEQNKKFLQETTEKYGGKRPFGLPLSLEDVSQLPQTIGFSAVAMGAGLAAVPLAAIPAVGVGLAWGVGTAASGKAAYEMATYQITQQFLEFKNNEKIATTGKELTAQEETALKDQFQYLAMQYGLWEAIPEAISNAAFLKILTLPLAKIVGHNVAGKIIEKVSAIYGEEFLTETITQMGQTNIEVKSGLSDQAPRDWLSLEDWSKSFKEIAPQTFLLTTLMTGAGTVIISPKVAYDKIRESLSKELAGKTSDEEKKKVLETIPEPSKEDYKQQATEQMVDGASPSQVALTIAEQVGAVKAEQIVKEAVQEAVGRAGTEGTIAQKRAEATPIQAGEGAKKAGEEMAALSEKTLETTNKEIHTEILAAQDKLDADVKAINEKITALETQVANAPARSQEKKDAKLALEKERANLRKAEADFNVSESEKSAGMEKLITDFAKTLADLTPGQKSDVYDATMQRLYDESAGVQTVRHIVKQVVAEAGFTQKPTKGVKEGYTRYTVNVNGKEFYADYNPSYVAGQPHIEFNAKVKGEAIPVSETGYRSHFPQGTLAEGVDVQKELQKLAEELAKGEKPAKKTQKEQVKEAVAKPRVKAAAEEAGKIEFDKGEFEFDKKQLKKAGIDVEAVGFGDSATVLKIGGVPAVGFSFTDEGLAGFSVAESFRKKGIAKQLLRTFAEERNGSLNVIDPNEAMLAVLNKLGTVSEPNGEGVVILKLDELEKPIIRLPDNVKPQGSKQTVGEIKSDVIATLEKYAHEAGQVEPYQAYADFKVIDVEIIGSRAVGTARPDSDLDIVVQYEGSATEQQVMDLVRDSDTETGEEIHGHGEVGFADLYTDLAATKEPISEYLLQDAKYRTLPQNKLEEPVAHAVKILLDAGEDTTSSGFHEGFSKEFNGLPPRWAIVLNGKPSQLLKDAANDSGLEVSVREAPKGTGRFLTDVSLPDVEQSETELAKETFDSFAEIYNTLDKESGKADNKGNGKETDNQGGGVDEKGLPEPLPAGGEEPGGAGGTTPIVGKGDGNRRAKRGKELGERPRLTNEEIEKAVASVTEISENGEVKITGEITDEILDAANQYTPGGTAKEGRGILDEYYTESQVVDMVKSLLDFPAKDLKVIEPSVGTGNFLYAIPEIGNHQVAALEINPTTAKIAKIFHPSVNVYNKPFETLFITERGERIPIEQSNQADLIIGNPPYGAHRGKYLGLGEEKGITKYEDYFIKRGLDMLKEGGTLAMVVPSSYLDQKMDVKNATLEVAYRLPEGVFKGTKIGTDIVIFKKKLGASNRVGGYFQNNPSNILGEVKERKNRFGKMEKYVDGDLESAQALFDQHKNDSSAKKILKKLDIKPTTENVEEAGAAIEEAGKGAEALIKEGEKAEKRAGKKTIAKVVKGAVKKDDTTVPLTAQFVEIPETELALWKKTNAQGFVENPTEEEKKSLNHYKGNWYNDFNYLQGDVYEKLEMLQKEDVPAGQRLAQKKKLESVLPTRESIDDIKLSPNHTFVKDLIVKKEDGKDMSLRSAFLSWLNDLPSKAFADSSNWEVKGYVNNEIVNGGDKDRNELERVRRKRVAEVLFTKYLREDLEDDTRRLVEDEYNKTYNFYHTPDYSKVPMFSDIHSTFNGGKLKLNAAQKEGIGRLVNRGVGILAHEVGFGKTLSGVLAAHETMARGWVKRPLIIAPNENVYAQWVKTIQETVPNAKVNLLGNLGAAYKGDLSSLKIEDGTFTLVTYEGLKRISFKDETYGSMAGKFSYIADDLNTHKSKRDQAKAEEGVKGIAGGMKKGTRADLFFEDLGFDHITFDEVHNANHIVSKAKIAKGTASEYSRFAIQPSDLGVKTWLAAQYIQGKNGGRNVNLLSATPFTNHPLEYYSILSLVADASLAKMRLHNVNDFFGSFMEANHEYEFKADGSYKPKTDIRKIKNYRQWKNLLGSYIDFRQDSPGIKRPNRVQMTYEIPQNTLTQEMNAKAQDIFNENEREEGKGAKTLRAINEFRKIAFSPYASKFSEEVKPEEYKKIVDGSPKLAVVMGIVAQNKKDKPEAGQILYSEVGVEFFPLLKSYLVKVVGFKPEEVEIITGKTAKPSRITIQDNFNAGKVKVLIGSEAISEGMNLQKNTTDMHLLSLPWNFTALRQVIGRAWRQGNDWRNVRINQYFIKDSIDVFLSQKLDNKQRRYEAAIASNANEVDVGDVSYNEMKSELIQDPEKRAKFEIEAQQEKIKAEILQAGAEVAFATRKLDKISVLLDKIKSDEEALATEKEEFWIDRYTKQIKQNKKEYAEELAKLKAKDIDVEVLLRKREEGEKKVAELTAQQKSIGETYDARVKEIVANLPKREFFTQDTLNKFVAERAEHNKTFYNTAETPVEETVNVETQVKEIKNAAGTKVVKTKKTTKAVKKAKVEQKETKGTKDQRVLGVLSNKGLSVAEKVSEILNVKQEGKEFKDTGERVGGSKKERAAINTVLENGDAAVIAEMIKTLGADTIAETLQKDDILENAVKPDVEQDKADKVPAFITGWKQKVLNSIGRTPSIVSQKGKYRSNRNVPEDAILPFLTNYGDYLRTFVKELAEVKTNEQAQGFMEKYQYEFVNIKVSDEAVKESGNPDYMPTADIDVLGRTIQSAIKDVRIYTRILQDITDVKEILEKGVQPDNSWRDGITRYTSLNYYGEGTATFRTKKEAEEKLKENREEKEKEMLKREEQLQNGYDYYLPKKKVRDEAVDLSHGNFKPLDNVVRSEPDIAEEELKPETLTKELGFKSVQLGNYMDDATAKEHIRYTIGAVRDMTKLLQIDFPMLMNKMGLSIAYGARGGGKANAHYEPSHNIINLTKGRGDGSFFHEFIHFLDWTTNAQGYRGKWSGGKERYYRHDGIDVATLDLIQAITGERIRKVKEFVPREDSYILDDKENWAMRARADGRTFESSVEEAKRRQYPGRSFQEVADVYRKNVKEETTVYNEKTDYYTASLAVGGGNADSYWVRPHELLARAGQAYIEDKMIAAGMKNNYLTRTTLGEKAYPQVAEREIFNGLFDKVFAELQKRYGIQEQGAPRFRLLDTFLERPVVNMTIAGQYLDDVKKRLNIDFDVHFADVIFARLEGKRKEAWGVTDDNTIVLAKRMAKYTAPHELVHLTLRNMDRMGIFQRNGITQSMVFRAKGKEMGLNPSLGSDAKKIDEELAKGFEKYLENKYEPAGIIRKFFALLKKLVLGLARVVVTTKNDIVKDYYDILDEGVALEEEYVNIENNGILEAFVEQVDGGILDLTSPDMRFKLVEEPDKHLQKIKGRFNDLVNKQKSLEENTEAWKTDLLKEVVIREQTAKLIEQTPEAVTGDFGKPGLIRFAKRTPPVGELTARGEAEVESLGFENVQEAQQALNDYLQRKTQLVSTRNRLRDLRRQIAQAKKDKKLNAPILRDIERKLKMRKRYLEQKDYYVGMGIGRGKKEQMKMIWKRGRAIRNIQYGFGISDKKAKDIIGGIGKQRIHLMTEQQFDDFTVEFFNRAQEMGNQLTAQDEVKAIIAEQQFGKWENMQKAMGLPSVEKMTEEQARRFVDVLSTYQFGDVFLTQRELETIHRTNWGDVKTERELLGKVQEHMGFGKDELKTLTGRSVSEYTPWVRLARKHPFFNWLVGKRVEATIQSEREYTQIEQDLNRLAGAARSSRRKQMGLGEKVTDILVPTDDIVFGYLESQDKAKYAEKMTGEELAFGEYLITQYHNAFEYLNSEYGMKERHNYMTHIRRSFFEAMKEEGIKAAFAEVFASQKEDEAAFKILDEETGNILAFEKFFGYALRRSGQIVPSKNIARASLAYFHSLSKKRALDKFIPEAMVAVQAHKAVVGTTEKGLTKDPTLEKFVKEFLNDAKGRKVKFITKQGSSSDIALRALVAWASLKYLGVNIAAAIGNLFGDFVAISWELGIREQARGVMRSVLHPLQAHDINQQFRYFTGRNPIVELFDKKYGLPERLKHSLMTLMGFASFQSNKFFLRSKMTDDEFRTGVIEDSRLKEIAMALSRVKPNKFYVKSLAGNTTAGSATFQFGTWAVAIINTVLSDAQELTKMFAKWEVKKGLTSQEAQKLLKFAVLAGAVWAVIPLVLGGDDKDYTLWGRTKRSIRNNLDTLIQAMTFLFQTGSDGNIKLFSPVIIKEITMWFTALQQFFTQEQYQRDGKGFQTGDMKWIRTGELIITPSALRQFFPDVKESAKESKIQEAIKSGSFNAEQIAKEVSPDWNDPKKMDADAKQRKIESIKMLYNLRKNYPESKLADIILTGDKLSDTVEKMVQYGKQVGEENVYSELKKLYHDRQLCGDQAKQTGCLVSGQLLKEYQKNRNK